MSSNEINNFTEHSRDNIYEIYDMAVESLEQYELEINHCKTLGNWSSLSQFEIACEEAVESLVQLEESNMYFTILIHIRDELFQTISKVKQSSQQIVVNDITITRVNDNPPMTPSFSPEPQPKRAKRECTEQNSMGAAIKDTVTVPKSKGLCDIVGLDEAKSILKEAVVLPLLYPHLFTGFRKPWTKALLYGPPGTGKTHLVHSIVAEVGAKLYCVSNADILSRWVGESEKMIRALFQHCLKSMERCVIFIDEVDGLCRKRTASEADHNRRMKNELLTQLSELDRENSCVFFIAATNCPWDIDPAFIRRFQKRIYIPLPDRLTRLNILKHYSKSLDSITEESWSTILDKTDGYSGSDITDLLNCVLYQPLKDIEKAKFWKITSDGKYIPSMVEDGTTFTSSLQDLPAHKITVRNANANDYFVALQTTSKTITNDEVLKFDEFNSSFGSLR